MSELGEVHTVARSEKVPLTANQQAWLEFIQMCSDEFDPPPTLAAVQALRVALRGGVPIT